MSSATAPRTQGSKSSAIVKNPEHIINDFSRFYILLLLFEGPKHGYEIIYSIGEKLGQKASPSLVYPFLKVLESGGLVDSQEESTGKRSRRKYSLTPAGKSLCSRLFRQFTTIVSSAIQPSMKVCAHCGCSVFKNGYSEVINGRRLAFCCKYCAGSFKKSTHSRGGN